MIMNKLSCGCKRGYFLCPEAERLWRDYNSAYYAKDWKRYEELRQEYKKHFEEAEE